MNKIGTDDYKRVFFFSVYNFGIMYLIEVLFTVFMLSRYLQIVSGDGSVE